MSLRSLLSAFLAVSTALHTVSASGYCHNSAASPSPRPIIQVGPKQPFAPIPTSPLRTRVCIVPAHNDGKTDDSPAILQAIKDCNNGGQVVFPASNKYLIGTALDLTFLSSIDLSIQGTITFTNDTDYWQANAFRQVFQNATTFFQLGGNDVNIYGGGTLDGNGQAWYDLYARDIYILRPILFGTIGLHNSAISHLNLRNSPQWYNFLANSSNVIFSDLHISGKSVSSNPAKNTDGIDTYRSTNIVFQNSVIDNGDDCVSFKPNSTRILVQNLVCTGSHGISVGSLGQYPGSYDIVEDVLVYNTTLTDVTDGARIKVWPGASAALSGDLQGGGGAGRVRNVTYDTMTVHNADYAIEVTQCYGQKDLALCSQYPSKLTIEDIVVRNVQGTASGKYKGVSGYVRCSSPSVCSNISLSNINVHSSASSGAINLFTCGNVDQSLLQGITCTTTDYGSN